MSHVGTTLVRKLAEYFERKHGDLDVNYPALIRSRLLLFVNSQIENPAFDSQMKDALIRFVDTRDSFFGGGGCLLLCIATVCSLPRDALGLCGIARYYITCAISPLCSCAVDTHHSCAFVSFLCTFCLQQQAWYLW